MTRVEEIRSALHSALSVAGAFDEETEAGRYHQVSGSLARVEEQAREELQTETADRIVPIIRALENGGDLDGGELALIRAWMVGDADAYLDAETNRPQWLAELNRLFEELGRMGDSPLDPPELRRLSGLAREALRVISDLVFYKQQEDRIEHFREATERLRSGDKQVLADLLTRKLDSARL